jgi:membrane-associated phospholipid phosphatase
MLEPTGRRRRPRSYVELVLLAGGYLLFGLARAAVDRGDPAATDNALRVQRTEQVLHLAVESSLNGAMLTQPFLMSATGYFYRLCLLAVPATLAWLYLSSPVAYRRWRTVLVAVTLLDLPLVWLFPLSPPRFALPGIVDYIAGRDILGGAASAVPRSGVNLLAAMPSMHVAWTTWCALALWSTLRQRHPRAAWMVWLLPAATALVVLVTGNHYLLDVIAGVALVGVTAALFRPSRFRVPRGRHT